MSDAVLVSGGAGFIGCRLVARLLAAGRRVVVLDSLLESVHGPAPSIPAEIAGARFVRGDVRDAEAWEDALDGVGLVYHFAAETGTGESMYRAQRYVDVNVNGTRRLCDVLERRAERPRRLLLASSRAIYGEGPYRCSEHGRVHPAPRAAERLALGRWEPICPRCGRDVAALPAGPGTETHPASVYGETKRDQEALLLARARELGLEAVALRLQNVYGAGQSVRNPYTGILSIFTVRLLDGEGVSIFEDGRESRDFVHVDDVAEAFLRAGVVALPTGALVADCGSGRATSVLEAARLLAAACGAGEDRIAVTGDYRVGDIRHAFCDPRPLHDALGAMPGVPLEVGIRDLVAWVRGTERPPSRLDAALDEMRAAGLLGRARSG